MRILHFSWKDIKNPLAGGAEVATFEIFRRLAKDFEIHWFTSNYQNKLPKKEEIEGITIYRMGSIKSVYYYAKKFYEKTKNYWDLIVDQINTIPFFTPLYVKQPILAYIHQLAWDVWDYEMKFMKIPGRLFEFSYLTLLYRNIPFVTVSNSTKEDLQRFGIKKVFVVPNGLNLEKYPLEESLKVEKENDIVYLGRITPMKRIEHLILAFKLVKKEVKDVKLYIVGRAKRKDYYDYLLSLVKRLNLEKDIIFTGYLSEEEKVELLTKSKIIVMTSVREGWGISIIEGNACGDVAVGYDVPGLRDSIKNSYNGFLVKNSDVAELSDKITLLLQDKKLFKKIQRNAIRWAKHFSWDRSAKKFKNILSSLSF